MFVMGGLLSIQPSKTQKRIAGLRQSALESGLHVKLPVSLKFPEAVAKSEYPYYCRVLPDRSYAHCFVHLYVDDNGHRQQKVLGLDRDIETLWRLLEKTGTAYPALYLGQGLIGVSWKETGVDEIPVELTNLLDEFIILICEK